MGKKLVFLYTNEISKRHKNNFFMVPYMSELYKTNQGLKEWGKSHYFDFNSWNKSDKYLHQDPLQVFDSTKDYNDENVYVFELNLHTVNFHMLRLYLNENESELRRDFVDEFISAIPEDLKSHINNGTVKLLFGQSMEMFDISAEELLPCLKKHNIDESKCYILENNILGKKTLGYDNSKINWVLFDYFKHMTLGNNTDKNQVSLITHHLENNYEKEKKFKYLLLMCRLRPLRYFLFSWLKGNKYYSNQGQISVIDRPVTDMDSNSTALFPRFTYRIDVSDNKDKGHVSVKEYNKKNIYTADNYLLRFQYTILQMYKNFLDYTHNQVVGLLDSKYFDKIDNMLPCKLVWDGSEKPFQESWESTWYIYYKKLNKEWPVHLDSYFSIVCESEREHFNLDEEISDSKYLFLTEKTYRCLHYHPFIVYSESAGVLKRLRELGFETFPELFDESYDEIENKKLRWKKVTQELQKVLSMDKQELHKIHLKLKPKILHNHYRARDFEFSDELYEELTK